MDEFHQHIRFSRGLRPWQVMTRGLGVVVVTIIFTLLGDVVAAAGPLTPLAVFLAALLLLANLLGYVELLMTRPRHGGAYAQVHETEDGGWLSFITGWSLILSGLGLCALLAHTFAIQTVTLLQEHLILSFPVWPWASGIVILLALNSALGTREGQRESMTFLALIAILLVVVLLAMPDIDPDNYARIAEPPDAIRLSWEYGIITLVSAFVGVEITINLQRGISQETRSTPRMLLLLPFFIALIGVLVSTVAVGVVGSEALADSSTPLALLGTAVAQGAGRPLVLIVGALALALALNKVFALVVRQVYAMSKDGYLPSRLHQIDPRFETPIWTIVFISLLMLPLTALPLSLLINLTGLLYWLVLMAVNLALASHPQSETTSFKLPYHPWVSALVLVLDLFIGLRWGVSYLVGAGILVSLGFIVYLAYAQKRHTKAKEGFTVFKPPRDETSEEQDYVVLVPIANPSTAGTLLRLSGTLARQEDGEVLALQVVTVPDQVPLEAGRRRAEVSRVLLERAVAQAQEEKFKIQTMTRVAHSVAEGILDTAREEKVGLILLGWRGYTRSFGASMGPIIDAVIRDAPCDVTVAKGDDWTEARKILIPTAGGPNAPIAARLSMLISNAYDAEVTTLYVQMGRATPQQMEKNKQQIAQTLEGLNFSHPPGKKVVVAESVVEGIVQEAEKYDLVLLGASEAGLFDQFIFGSIPQQIAARVPKTAVIVRRYGGPTEFWVRKLMRGLLRIFPRLNVEEQLNLREALSDSARPEANYFVLTVLSSIIATLGLLLDSAAVVIGAMLVAPLMSPILGLSLGMVLGDVRLIRLSIEAMFKGVALALLIAVAISIGSPFKNLTGEILARTQPTLLDLAVALASGMAGAYALAREEVSAALPGVAIAAALMPPLCVAGLGLSLGNPQVAGGAFLLFLANIAAISLAGVIIFLLLGVHPQVWQPEMRWHYQRALVGFALLMLVIAIPLGVIMSGIARETALQQAIQGVLEESLVAHDEEMVSFDYRQEETSLEIIATVRSPHSADQESVDATAAILEEELEREITLEVVTLPVIRSEQK